jgi:serine phosphatase RsbU (regulator of sigma subunit)/catechol 2,3-dioxygenase-like lactoylglutathione lyase family enzyme
MDNPPRHPYLRLHAVNVYVKNQERSLKFYVEQLGFNVIFDVQLQTGERWVAVGPPDGTAVLALIQANPKAPEYKLVGRATQAVFLTEDVTAKFREWRSRGVRFLNTPRLRRVQFERAAPPLGSQPHDPATVWGGVFTRFRDLDGNSFGLVGFDEVTRDLEEQRRIATEKLDAERRAVQELEIAKQVQARLFPQTLPLLQTLEYAGICIQARQVGGDYYDFLQLSRGRRGLVIGDIAGKGFAAALLMANLQANLRSQCATAVQHPRRFLQSVNRLFYENTADSAYATLFFGEYDDRTRSLRYANCGHLCGLVLRRNGDLERLTSTATLVGIFEDWDCDIEQCQLRKGDMFALYTDGITESLNDAEDEFGESRLVESLRQHRAKPAHEVISSIVEDVQNFSPNEQGDDITLIVAKVR